MALPKLEKGLKKSGRTLQDVEIGTGGFQVTASSIVGLAPRMIPRSRADNPPDYLQELEQARCHLVRRIPLSNPYPRCSCKIGISAS